MTLKENNTLSGPEVDSPPPPATQKTIHYLLSGPDWQ